MTQGDVGSRRRGQGRVECGPVRPRPTCLRPLLLAGVLLATAAGAEEIKIEVARGRPQVALAGAGATFSQGPDGAAVEAAGGEHAVRAQGEALLLDGARVREPLVAHAGKEPLRVDGKRLPGRLEIWAEKGGLVVVNALDLEEYVSAVVASEVPASWPAAALQAQAVAARTFAVAQKIELGRGARAHLGSSVLDQVYAGAAKPQGGAREAARATLGEVLTWEAAPIQAFFSAACGGKGESGEAAFGLPKGSAPYLPGGDDGAYDEGAPRLRWTVALKPAELTATLRKAGRLQAEVTGVEVAATTATGRASKLRLTVKGAKPVTMAATELRQLLGWQKLPSLLFEVAGEGGAIVFRGRGSGHGVGLCQWGARGRAAKGEGYREILAHYYPGAELRRMY